MAYKKEVLGTYNGGTCVEARITETTDICHLLSDGKMLMIDSCNLEDAKAGKRIHALIMNIETGNVMSNKYYKLDDEIEDDLWHEHEFRRSYVTEFDYS